MADTYSSKPFISYDGKDDQGVRAEVKVVLGYGHIFDIEDSDKGKAAKVSFKVENTKFKPSGWAPMDSDVLKKAREAQATGEAIHFRLETHRKNSVDRTIPINDISSTADLARENVFKSLAAVKREDDERWTMNPNALTNPAEDPRSNNGRYSALDMDPSELGNKRPAAAPAGGGYRRKGFEASPFEYSNPDGSRNAGAIAAKVPMLFLNFVTERANKIEGGAEVSDKNRMKVAMALMKIADSAQVAIYEGALEQADANLGSHTTARELVYKIADLYIPLTAEIMNDSAQLTTWSKDALKKAVGMWQWSLKLTAKEETSIEE